MSELMSFMLGCGLTAIVLYNLFDRSQRRLKLKYRIDVEALYGHIITLRNALIKEQMKNDITKPSKPSKS